ncbi:E motif [Dillenia turbinata]|uniref:E motif n=1 Tax=Dillenia turbinata TaxID=194707 RepID=A0AAN8UJ27_9MAGN
MYKYGRGVRLFCSASASISRKTSWDPTVSLSLQHPSLVLLESCTTRVHFKQILAQIMRKNLIGQTFPMSRLLLYSAVSYPENLDMASLLFSHFTPYPNVFIYNTMISAFSFSPCQSFTLYSSMLKSKVYPNRHTLLHLVQASDCMLAGMQIHCHAIVMGLFTYGYLQNSLLKLYLQNGKLELACQVFEEMLCPDVITYNIMIFGYAKNGCGLEAVELFKDMVRLDIEPDEYTMLGLLVCCGHLGDANMGNSIHAWIERRKVRNSSNLILSNALLDVYVKCKKLETARRVFDAAMKRDVVSWNTMIAGYSKVGELELAHKFLDEMPCRDLVSWNSLLAGYAQRGDYMMVRKLFNDMVSENFKPDKMTMVSLISATAEVGGLDKGRSIHGQVIRMGMATDAFLCSALIEMYCKCGSIESALAVFKGVTEKDVTLWTTMIRGLAFHEPEKEGGYILLSNVYAASGRWSQSDMMREIMKGRGMKKSAGCSSLMVDGVVHDFMAADEQHPRWPEIRSILLCLKSEMKIFPWISNESQNYMQTVDNL